MIKNFLYQSINARIKIILTFVKMVKPSLGIGKQILKFYAIPDFILRTRNKIHTPEKYHVYL